MTKRIHVTALALFVLCGQSWGASLNFTGNFRTEASLFNRPGLSAPNTNTTKTYIQGRALLEPKLVIDDHFSIKSQWSLLASPTLTPNAAQPLGQGQGGYIFGDPNSASLLMSRAWLEWVSDFGIVRLGRMPVSWGYGLVWDAGDEIWDDFQTTWDRIEYRLQFGHLIGALAYSKPRKLSVLGNDSDQDFYSLFIKYENPEDDVEGGIMVERQVRSGSPADLMGAANPYHISGAATTALPPLAVSGPYPTSNYVVDAYVKKTIDQFTFGGEVGWATGNAVTPFGGPVTMSAVGAIANITYEYHKVKGFVDFLYASGDSNLAGGHMNGFVLLHRNRRPGLILGRELLGPYSGNNAAQGSLFYYGTASTFSGAWYLRPGFRVDWSDTWGTGIEFIYAQKAVTAGDAANLGFEVDLGVDHAFYKNFDVGLDLGYLFAGAGLGAGTSQGVFAVRTTASLKF
jgi:hypothetical protein